MRPSHWPTGLATSGLAVAAALGAVGYRLVVGGELTLDTGLGRRVRPLGPLTVTIAAPWEATVRGSLSRIREETERRAAANRRRRV